MKNTKDQIPAVVFGLFETGLGVIRSLGIHGIPVVGIDFKKDIGWYSRYVKPLISPPPNEDENLINWLFANFKGYQKKCPVFITSDDFLNFVNRNRDVLSELFIIDMPEHRLIQSLSDKYEQFKLAKSAGVNVPETRVVRSNVDLQKLIETELPFPLFMKGLDVTSWRKHFGGSQKGFILGNNDQLLSRLNDIDLEAVPVILQELIEGPDEAHFKYCAYIDSQGNFLAEFMLQKIRQYPVHFGVGSAVKSIWDPLLLEEGRKFFKQIDYRGVGSAEFKWDTKRRRFVLIELNPRYWQQNYLATFCGLNFPLIQYRNLIENIKNTETDYDTDKFWINRYMDFSAYLDYRREGALTFRQWRKSIAGRRVYPDFLWKDPVPVLYEFDFGRKLLRIPGFFYRKLFR